MLRNGLAAALLAAAASVSFAGSGLAQPGDGSADPGGATAEEGTIGGEQRDLDCEDFGTAQSAAQALIESQPGDPNNLDRDNDGVACEEAGGAQPAGIFDRDVELDCEDFGQEGEQGGAEPLVESRPADPNNLDPDNDGVACDEEAAGGTEEADTQDAEPQESGEPELFSLLGELLG